MAKRKFFRENNKRNNGASGRKKKTMKRTQICLHKTGHPSTHKFLKLDVMIEAKVIISPDALDNDV